MSTAPGLEPRQSPAAVTFLFTDIAGSTRLAQEHADRWESLQERHHEILQGVMQAHHGHVFQIIGDAFCVAFGSPREALEAAVEAQRRLQAEAWGKAAVSVRMGLHTGPAERREDGYRGYLTMARVQRVMSAGHGGQILLSSWTAESLGNDLAAGVQLRDLELHHLKGFHEPERLWQVLASDLRQDFPPLPTLNRAPNNLPVQLSSFIGREKEVAEVADLLGARRLVTLTGSGGTGKTRLALQVAEQVQGRFKDGVWWIELAPLSEPALLPASIAAVLGIQEEPGRPALAALTEWMHDKELMIVLDNCEHLIQACAETADAILRSGGTTRIFATSREPLGIDGETSYRVPSLRTPETPNEMGLDQVVHFASVQLFVDRARQASSSFQLTEKNAPAVARICASLDGIPLAIELAAARISALTVEQLAARLTDRFRLLSRGGRTALPRHQTLRAMIDWSYDLLSESEQSLLCRVSVFSGGWTLESAEQVCGQQDSATDVLSLLANLVDKSLVVLDETEDGGRYHLLETTRQYAAEKLAGEDAAVRDRHLAYFLGLAETGEVHLRGEAQLGWLSRLEQELNNMRTALEWSQNGGSKTDGLRLATALHWFWNLRSLLREGHEWLVRTLRSAERAGLTPELRARALHRVAHLAHYLGEPLDERRALLLESLELNRKLGRDEDCGHALVMLAWITPAPNEAEALYAEALERGRRSGNPWMVPATLMNLADFMVDLKQDDRALAYLHECIPEFRALGDRWAIAWSLLLLATIKIRAGDEHEVDDLLAESLRLFNELRFRVGARLVLSARAEMEFKRGNYEEAAQLFEENLSLARDMGLRNAIAMGALLLGVVMGRLGDHARAAELMRESLVSFKERGILSQIPACLGSLAQIHVARGKPEAAARLLAAARLQGEALGRPLIPLDLQDWTSALEAIRAKLDGPTFEQAVEEGRRLTLDEATTLALMD